MNSAVSLEKVHIEKIGTRSGPSIIFKGIGLCSVHITQHGKEQGQKPSCQRNGCGNWAWQLGFLRQKKRGKPVIPVKLFPLSPPSDGQWIWVAGCGRSAYPLVGLVEGKLRSKSRRFSYPKLDFSSLFVSKPRIFVTVRV